MEPQENKQLAIRKAITAHEQAEAAVMDLMKDDSGGPYAQMLEGLQRNVALLRSEAEATPPSEHV